MLCFSAKQMYPSVRFEHITGKNLRICIASLLIDIEKHIARAAQHPRIDLKTPTKQRLMH